MNQEGKSIVLIACDKFKGSLDALEVADAVQAGFSTDDWEIRKCPIADGGEGFVDAMLVGAGGRKITMDAVDALGRACRVEYGLADLRGVKTAFIEMSAASGIWRIPPEIRRPRESTTYGTGMMIRHAVEVSEAERIYIGIGGSVTNDGGAGMAVALGVRFLDQGGNLLDGSPNSLAILHRIDETKRIPLPEIIVACDVEHPLCGEEGASTVFGPQKGASAEDVEFLDGVLVRLAKISDGEEIAKMAGAGAAGGLGFGLMRFARAHLESGFEIVAGALALASQIAQADLVITGEGSLDVQTLGGKGPAGVAGMARAAGVPVIGIAGKIEGNVGELFDHVMSLESFHLPKERSMAEASVWLTRLIMDNAQIFTKISERTFEKS